MLFFSIFCGSAKYIEKRQADRSSEIQWAPKLKPKIDQAAPKALQN
jgi:hypothetical protein